MPLLAALLLGGLSGCASVSDQQAGDPLARVNRVVFSFNENADHYVVKPVATAYTHTVPSPARTAVRNFFSNLGDIGNVANEILQLKGTAATQDIMRLAFNSTFGLGGLIDWATPAGLPKHHEDFGLTLAHYGVPMGPYLMLPLLGPSSVRDSTDFAVESLINPFSYASTVTQLSVDATRVVSKRADLMAASDLLSAAAIDRYAFVRSLYMANRKNESGDNGETDLPNYGNPQ
ncbi:VacJ family lipoprotein [Paraburkholderia acidisoli]|uniref:VacJ family lipoprotein n=2 Tax=Paraburkholderia acidisoli TaxID=2571748 RepID=A0A7Z2GQC7_9BURK|nr:VacJ family lipoprotein [Paraburkholderia acidisoli]